MPPIVAELYAMLHRGAPGDVSFYRRVCRGADCVLELGAGAGRLSVPLAASGLEVTALEREPAMLALARAAAAREPEAVARRLAWVQGDMRSFDLGRRYDRVIIAHNTLWCLGGASELQACLERTRAHLAVGGQLWLDVYRADVFHGEDLEEDDDAPLVAFEHGGRTYDVFETSTMEPSSQRIDARYRFVPRDGGDVVEHTIAHRYALQSELTGLIASVGLSRIALHGGFAGEPCDDEAERIVLGAERR